VTIWHLHHFHKCCHLCD